MISTPLLAQNLNNHKQKQAKTEVKIVAKITRKLFSRQVNFFRVSPESVVGSFDGGIASSYGGAIPLGELNQQLGYTEGAATAMRDWRKGKKDYSLAQLLTQRVILACCGLTTTADSDHFRHDPALRLAIGLGLQSDRTLASQPTMSRLDGMNRANCYRLAVWLLLFYISTRKKAPKQIIIDFDGSCFPVHGNQAHSSYRTNYRTHMYFPLLVYDQDGWLITAVLRPGYYPEKALAYGVLTRVMRKLKDAWKDTRFIVRLDAGFGDSRILDWCEDNGIFYTIRFNPGGTKGGLYSLTEHTSRTSKRVFRRKFGSEKYLGEGGGKAKHADEKEARKLPRNERAKALRNMESRRVRLFGDIEYRKGGGGLDKKQWRSDRRVVTVVDHTDKGNHRIFIITNMPDPARYIYEELYCKRGTTEQNIGQFKAAFGTKLSSPEFTPNQFRLLVNVMSYNLLFMLRQQLPAAHRGRTLKSFQSQFIKLAVMVKQKYRRAVLSWTSHYQYIREFIYMCSRIHFLRI